MIMMTGKRVTSEPDKRYFIVTALLFDPNQPSRCVEIDNIYYNFSLADPRLVIDTLIAIHLYYACANLCANNMTVSTQLWTALATTLCAVASNEPVATGKLLTTR